MDFLVWMLLGFGVITVLFFLISFIISMWKKEQCSNCHKVFRGKDLNVCSENDCEKEYCQNCEKINLKECKDCGNSYCPKHFAGHDCNSDDEDEDDDEEYTQDMSKDMKVIVSNIGSISEKQIANKISEIMSNGYELKAGDQNYLFFVKKDEK